MAPEHLVIDVTRVKRKDTNKGGTAHLRPWATFLFLEART